MQMAQETAGAWILWAMLATGAGLVIASLWQTSERFWHWKRAQQMNAGELMPANVVLRVGQTLTFTAQPSSPEAATPGQHEDVSASASWLHSECGAHIHSLSRGQLWFTLEAPSVSRSSGLRDTSCEAVPYIPQEGETLAFTVTGEDALYHFVARVRDAHSDPALPGLMRFSVKMPLWLARRQRRQHVRVPLELRAAFAPSGVFPAPATAGAEAIRGTLLDLSGGGLRVELDGAQSPHVAARLCEQLKAGAILEVKLDTPLLREETLRLAVRDCRRIAARGGLGVRLRGEFIDLPAWQRDTLISMVFHAQRLHSRQPAPRLQTVG